MSRKGAAKPKPRMVEVKLNSEYTGWVATARADFPARVLADLQSGQMDRIIPALDIIIVHHNMPDIDGNVAASMGDVDPYDGMIKMAGAIFDAIGSLPNR